MEYVHHKHVLGYTEDAEETRILLGSLSIVVRVVVLAQISHRFCNLNNETYTCITQFCTRTAVI
jgi:hypothetical protein